MIDERAIVAEVEAADPPMLAQLLRRPRAAEERALRAYFGDERFQRLQRLAAHDERARLAETGPIGNVVVMPGLMGSALTAFGRDAWSSEVWLSYWGIFRGRLKYLRLGENGRDPFDPAVHARPTGVLKKYYAELVLSLHQRGWNVREFPYDWRKDLDQSADALRDQVTGWFGPAAPFHIVAHSMGGLVARAFTKRHPARWKVAPVGPAGGRLVMLGTPNHGAFLIPQAITGLADTVWKIERLDVTQDMAGTLLVLDSFPGLYQMLPSPLVLPNVEPLYRAGSYPGLTVPQRHLDRARITHEALADVIDPTRMVHVAGYGQPTVTGIRDFTRLRDLSAYVVTSAGDGSVPLALGPPRLRDGSLSSVPVHYVKEEHTRLASSPTVLNLVDEVLRTGRSTAPVPATAPSPVSAAMATRDAPAARRAWIAHREAGRKRFDALVKKSTAKAPRATAAAPSKIPPEESEALDQLAAEFIGAPAPAAPRRTKPASARTAKPRTPVKKPKPKPTSTKTKTQTETKAKAPVKKAQARKLTPKSASPKTKPGTARGAAKTKTARKRRP